MEIGSPFVKEIVWIVLKNPCQIYVVQHCPDVSLALQLNNSKIY